MLVVVWYSHVTLKLEIDPFLFQFKLFMKKSSKKVFLVQIKTGGLFWGVNTWKVLSGDELILKSHTIEMGHVPLYMKMLC